MGRSVAQQAEDNRRRRAAGQPEVPISYDSGPPNPAERPTVGYGQPATPAVGTGAPPPPPTPAPQPVPQSQPFNPPPSVQANTPTLPTYTPPATVNPITAVKADAVNPVVATHAAGSTIGGPNVVGTQNFDSAVTVKPTLAANTTINRADQDQTRGQQMDFLNMLRSAAYGTGGPSAAESMYKSASDDAINNQLALAGMAHGYGGQLAGMQAGKNIAGIQAKAGLDTGIIRAQEQQAARGLLGQTIGNARDADLKLAMAQADLDAATEALNANLSTNVDLSNASEVNKRNQLKAQLDQATAFRNAAADEAIRVRNAELSQNNEQFNAGQDTNVAVSNADRTQQNTQFNAGQENATSQFNTNIEQQRNLLDAQLRQNLGISMAQLQSDINKFNAGEANHNTQFYANLTNQRDIAQLQAALQTMGYTNDQIRAFLGAYMGAAGNVAATDTNNRQQQDQFFWDMVNMGANFIAPGSGTALKASGVTSNARPVTNYAGADPSGLPTNNVA